MRYEVTISTSRTRKLDHFDIEDVIHAYDHNARIAPHANGDYSALVKCDDVHEVRVSLEAMGYQVLAIHNLDSGEHWWRGDPTPSQMRRKEARRTFYLQKKARKDARRNKNKPPENEK